MGGPHDADPERIGRHRVGAEAVAARHFGLAVDARQARAHGLSHPRCREVGGRRGEAPPVEGGLGVDDGLEAGGVGGGVGLVHAGSSRRVGKGFRQSRAGVYSRWFV